LILTQKEPSVKKTVLFLLLFIAGILPLAGELQATPTFTIIPYLRLRYEYWKNLSDMNTAIPDDRSFYRFKISLAGQADFTKNLDAFVKLTNESRAYIYYAGGNATYNINETVFDNLYADVKNIDGLPLELRLGRQDLLGLYGEGFLFGDGTPVDGSRTYYFNAAKASWRINTTNTLDCLYIVDNKYDNILPIINEINGRQQLNATDEHAFALYHKSDVSSAFHLEDYYIWKHEDGGGTLLSAQETTLNTVGSFARYLPLSWLTVRGQLAYQFGTYGTNDRTGLGGYVFTDAVFKDTLWTPQVTAGYIYLSGDDRSTATNEAWDPLFSRYPWMSELYVLSYTKETGTGYWTDLNLTRIGASINPLPKTKLTLTYNILGANQTVAGTLFGTGTDRGKLYQGRIDYTFTKNISAYVLTEYFTPGNFYVGSDPAEFVRVELQCKY
jgi:hypothetical protein